MPYREEWAEPEVFVEHAGVTVYRIYKGDDFNSGPRLYWFSTHMEGSDSDAPGENGTFDVRDLDIDGDRETDNGCQAIIREAIDRGTIGVNG